MIINKIKSYLKFHKFKRKWYKLNPHNETIPMRIFRDDKVLVGKKTYGGLNVMTFNNDTKLTIGNYCSIAGGVQFLLDSGHQLNTITTFPLKKKEFGLDENVISKGDIIVGDDVWIGTNAIISSGVHIGQGAVVAAGAVVTKNIEPYAIVGGNPAKVIRYRFDEVIRKRLLELNIVNLFDNINRNDIELLYTEININNYQDVISALQYLVKKNENIH